jgi:hypothetical protein
MDLKKELTREGVRGGQEQFKWDSLKSMSSKQREHYLGYTTKIGISGKFGQYSKNDWWRSKSSSEKPDASPEDERRSAKDLENELMQEALGLKPQRLMLAKNQLSADQMNIIVKKDESTSSNAESHTQPPSHATIGSRESGSDESAPVRGLGFNQFSNSRPIQIFDDEDVDVLHHIGELPKAEVKQERERSRSRSRSRGIIRPKFRQ